MRQLLELDEDEFNELRMILSESEDDLTRIRRKGVSILQNSYQPLPQLDPALTRLNAERNDLMNRTIQKIKKQFGVKDFERIDKKIQQIVIDRLRITQSDTTGGN